MQGFIRAESWAPILTCSHTCRVELLDYPVKNTEGQRLKGTSDKDL